MQNLKNYLINNNVTKISDIKDDEIKLRFLEIHSKFKKGKYIKATIEYIKMDMNIACSCCSGLELNYNTFSGKFFDSCSICKISKISDGVKNSRLNETIYDGDFYDINDLEKKLKTMDLSKYYGSGSQRKLIKDDRKLYFSILKHSEIINNIKGINLKCRVFYLINKPNTYCKCGEQQKFDNKKNCFLEFCQKCKPMYPSIEWFKLKYGSNYLIELDKDRKKRVEKLKGVGNFDWYINKYGIELGRKKFNNKYKKIFSNIPYSKISQNLFWELKKILNSDKINFAEFNNEINIILTDGEKDILGQNFILLDFVYKNKVIEFNGEYWHKSNISRENDIKKKRICESKGYDVLFVWEKEYKSDPENTIKRCIRFLTSPQNIKFNDRYLIETTNGYEPFDNIMSRGNKKQIKFVTDDTEISVSENHIFRIMGVDVIAKNLNIGDYLQYRDKLTVIRKIEYLEGEVFDVLNTNSNTYLANDINNHNCSFLGSSHTLISSDKLREFETKEPEEIRDGKLKIYHYPKPGHKYIMAVDAAKDGNDAFAVQIVDITDFKFVQVATAQLQIDYLLMPEYINDWCEYYNLPYLIIENNEGAGQSIADQMKNDYEYENLHYDKSETSNSSNLSKGRKKYPGFRTSQKSRKLILQTMKLFIENNNLVINDRATIKEFFTFILINNKYQADENCHDDMIMSLALIFAPFCNNKNFDDMKELIKNLYSTEPEGTESEKSSFTEYLNFGSFDDGTDIEIEYQSNNTWNGYNLEPDGFY